ncbi:hypothetical protein [Acetobacterium wieringae]|uniref:hypothetical protein n=1 Tax=Acetobacterium wieringae TaxID=52694 RepID=UPI001651D9C4|nr:hypothetical protein [Acetobacterium wieringae]
MADKRTQRIVKIQKKMGRVTAKWVGSGAGQDDGGGIKRMHISKALIEEQLTLME